MAEAKGTFKPIVIGTGDRTREIDLSTLKPLTMGDRKRLVTDLKLDAGKMGQFTPEEDVKLVCFILRKIDPTVTEDEVEGLPTLVGQSIVEYLWEVSANVDRPFLRSSTASPPPMVGEEKK